MTAAPVVAGRADARRNREVVLRTAARVFAEEGLDVSISRIAQRAEVGAGTVYRHFPSKEILVEAVVAGHVEGLVTAADRWATRTAPGDALFGFLLDVIERSAGRRHVCEALIADRSWPRATLTAAVRRFDEALSRLLRNAKQAGAVRVDVQADDLAALTIGGAALLSAHSNSRRGKRLVRIMLDSVRATAVTKPAMFRDVAASVGHETHGDQQGDQHCRECGTGLRVRTTGRPARYCGPTCRQRARRRRAVG